ncbi:GDP-mannose 4,6-dehydratase [Sporolactobacillus inulinus]|uniref:NAD(P)-binding domain-containing protein n=1 Tax=Sporolactobacillus inulinus CASD TaxID=1069536 RepID=A0A0U1QMH4_9BACL|nr:GDP-mannose 4,6-dehydratase [Sporolactobacillus inulinus]KLI02009.1 hypothetical protein SINU_10405 [Sporolactobacillus inulinus CASD]GEB77841.1 GDP-6-deoxy-D-lyxo-4-hexulose reductase [Sporolactobacillus inulinus]
MRILITGANGFVANHLVKQVINHDIYLTSHSDQTIIDDEQIFKMDVRDEDSIRKVLHAVNPDVIVHLAAQSNVPFAWKHPVETMEINAIGTTNLISSIIKLKLSTKLIVVGSSDEYGITAKTRQLLSESDPCLPQNPYAISKLAAEQLGIQLARKHHVNIVCLRPFNHFGSGQKKGFVVSDFCSQIAEIERGIQEPTIQVGDISTYRDFLPVDDVVNAYITAINKDIPNDIYNISSGKPIKIEKILEKLIGFSNKKITVVRDDRRYRPAEVKSFAGDYSKFNEATNWSPKYDIDECLLRTLNWWRNKV